MFSEDEWFLSLSQKRFSSIRPDINQSKPGARAIVPLVREHSFMPDLTPEHVDQLRRFLPARDGDPVKIPRILLDADDIRLCRELVAAE